MCLRQCSPILYSPFVVGQIDEQVLLCTQERLTEENLTCWELPFLGVFVLDDEIGTIFWGVVEGTLVWTLRVDICKIFTCCTVLHRLTCLWVYHLMCGEIIEILLTCIRVAGQDVLIHL